jgi:hypothetical protein
MIPSNSDKQATWLLLQLAEQGRNVEVMAQNLASVLVSTSCSVEEFAGELAAIIMRTKELIESQMDIWPGLLPGGAGPDFDEMVSPVEYDTPMREVDWDALVTAERSLYRDDPGCHGYTDVNVRSENHPVLSKVWGHVEDNLAGTHPEWEIASTDYRRRMIASRVARTMAVMAFGPEFLLR